MVVTKRVTLGTRLQQCRALVYSDTNMFATPVPRSFGLDETDRGKPRYAFLRQNSINTVPAKERVNNIDLGIALRQCVFASL